MTAPTNVLPELLTPADGAELCAACSHPMANHDVTGVRYCAATTSMAHTRGCICRDVK
jgi:hypothetical protein